MLSGKQSLARVATPSKPHVRSRSTYEQMVVTWPSLSLAVSVVVPHSESMALLQNDGGVHAVVKSPTGETGVELEV
jgi:hypothetical protein